MPPTSSGNTTDRTNALLSCRNNARRRATASHPNNGPTHRPPAFFGRPVRRADTRHRRSNPRVSRLAICPTRALQQSIRKSAFRRSGVAKRLWRTSCHPFCFSFLLGHRQFQCSVKPVCECTGQFHGRGKTLSVNFIRCVGPKHFPQQLIARSGHALLGHLYVLRSSSRTFCPVSVSKRRVTPSGSI